MILPPNTSHLILPLHEAVQPLFPEVIVSISDLVPGLGNVVQFGDSLEVDLECKISLDNVTMLSSIFIFFREKNAILI